MAEVCPVLHALPTVSLPTGTCIHNAHAVIMHLQGQGMLPACWQEEPAGKQPPDHNLCLLLL